jgi:deoxyribodipyrimidine photolyase-like uncharacterized protein
MRVKTGVLMGGEKPAGDKRNFDHDNRAFFGKDGLGLLPVLRHFALTAANVYGERVDAWSV